MLKRHSSSQTEGCACESAARARAQNESVACFMRSATCYLGARAGVGAQNQSVAYLMTGTKEARGRTMKRYGPEKQSMRVQNKARLMTGIREAKGRGPKGSRAEPRPGPANQDGQRRESRETEERYGGFRAESHRQGAEARGLSLSLERETRRPKDSRERHGGQRTLERETRRPKDSLERDTEAKGLSRERHGGQRTLSRETREPRDSLSRETRRQKDSRKDFADDPNRVVKERREALPLGSSRQGEAGPGPVRLWPLITGRASPARRPENARINRTNHQNNF